MNEMLGLISFDGTHILRAFLLETQKGSFLLHQLSLQQLCIFSWIREVYEKDNEQAVVVKEKQAR